MSFSERGHFSLCQCRGPAGDCFPAGPKSTLSSTFYPPGLLRFQGEYRIGLGRFPTLHADRQDHDRQRNQPRQPEEPAMQSHLIRIVAEPPRSRGRGLLDLSPEPWFISLSAVESTPVSSTVPACIVPLRPTPADTLRAAHTPRR